MYIYSCMSTTCTCYTNLHTSLLQRKQAYEKIGEPTEVALMVLAEKANVQGMERSNLSPHEKSCACFKACKSEFQKVFTLEFSRDRKSMSVYCKDKDGKPVMFVKVDQH